MHLDDWKNLNVGDPLPYFRSTLGAINRNAVNAPGQAVVEQVLSTVFPKGFSATLKALPFKAAAPNPSIHQNLKDALIAALKPLGSPGAIIPDTITPGFEDMLLSPPTGPLPKAPAPLPAPGPAPGGGGATELYALQEAIGAAFIDYFNGYNVDSINEAFEGYGGTDLHIRNALYGTFEQKFGPDFDTTLGVVDIGPTASVAMQTLAKEFGAQLQTSLTTYPAVKLDQVFAGLDSL
jgi:hypothetical protein